jgi:hypothetical protein
MKGLNAGANGFSAGFFGSLVEQGFKLIGTVLV